MNTRSTLTNGFIRVIPLLFATMILASTATASPDGFGGKNQQEDPYQELLAQQIQLIAPTEEQTEAFREGLREYFDMRNGSTRRIGRQGGDVDVRVSRELRRCARASVEAMSKVLTAEQLPHYEKLVEIGNEQYMANAGLL